jgi:hypothetical protein
LSAVAENPAPVLLDGGSLSLVDLARIARDPTTRIEIAPAALDRVRRSWSTG